MNVVRTVAIWFLVLAVLSAPVAARGQQVTIGTPTQVLNDSFYENFGFNWGFNRSGPGGGVSFNSGGAAVPPFGGFDPNGQATFGFRNNGFSFNFSAGAGSSRSIVSETPYITIPNGGYGVLNHSSLRPFVTGVVPVVGDRPMTVLDERLHRLRTEPQPPSAGGSAGQSAEPREVPDTPEGDLRLSAPGNRSSAEEAELSVAEIRRQQAEKDAAKAAEVAELIGHGKTAEAAGKSVVARIYYERAARRADGQLRQRLQAKIAELRASSASGR